MDISLRQAITRIFIDTFNDMLKDIEAKPVYRFTHIDLRNTLIDEAHWADDIHPSKSGVKLLASRLSDGIKAIRAA